MPTFIHGKGAYFALSTATTKTSTNATFINFSSGVEEVSLPRSVDTAEITTYGDGDREYIAGLRSGTISVTGIWASTYEEKIVTSLGSSKSVAFSFGPAGNTAGRRRERGKGIITSYEIGAPVGDKVSMSFEIQITGAVASTTF